MITVIKMCFVTHILVHLPQNTHDLYCMLCKIKYNDMTTMIVMMILLYILENVNVSFINKI